MPYSQLKREIRNTMHAYDNRQLYLFINNHNNPSVHVNEDAGPVVAPEARERQ